jgi:hypothetical protein
MSEAIFMEYMGFTSTTRGREYAFHVLFSPPDSLDYTVTIGAEAFRSRRVSYQDGPYICSSRLKRELSAKPRASTETSFLIDEKEIDDHKLRRIAEAPKRRDGKKLPNGRLTHG